MVEDNRIKFGKGNFEKAVTAAVNEAIKQNLLGGYFKKWKKEAIMDWLTEFDEEGYNEVMRNDAYLDGVDDGIRQGIEQGIEQGRAEAQEQLAQMALEIESLRLQLAQR